MVAVMQTVDVDRPARSSSERSDGKPGLHLLARQRHEAPANVADFEVPSQRAIARSLTGRRTARAVLAGRHVQDHQVHAAHSINRLPSTAAPASMLQTHLDASMGASPWLLPRLRAMAPCTPDLETRRMAPAKTPIGSHVRRCRDPSHGRSDDVHHLGFKVLDPGQLTEPIHAETDCVHRVCLRRHRKRGRNRFRATANYGYSFPWCRSPSWVCSARRPNGSMIATAISTPQHRPGHLRHNAVCMDHHRTGMGLILWTAPSPRVSVRSGRGISAGVSIRPGRF